MATPQPPPDVGRLLGLGPGNYPVCEDFELDYEPRSMAVHPDGSLIAVGTKAGEVHVAECRDGHWNCRLAWSDQASESPPSAIRALLFLDERTLVAGRGHGEFLLVDLDQRTMKSVRAHPTTETPEPRSTRFRRMIPLSKDESGRFDVLGVTFAGKLYLFSRDVSGACSARSVESEEVLPGLQGLLVDGTWAAGCLWVLDSGGVLHRFRVVEGKAIRPRTFSLGLRTAIGELVGVSGCAWGLTILRSEAVGFLRFFHDGSGDSIDPDDVLVAPEEARWVQVRNVLDGATVLPYYTPGRRFNDPIDASAPLLTVVATKAPRLAWIEWTDRRDNDHACDPVRVFRAPFFSSSEDVRPVNLRFAWGRSGGAVVLACATRDHKLRVASLLDRATVGSALEHQFAPALLRTPLGDASREELHTPGVSLWLAEKRILDNLDLADPIVRQALQCRESSELDVLDRGDLLRLTDHLLESWAHHFDRNPADRSVREKTFEKWIHLLLKRSHQIQPKSRQEDHGDLAREIGRRINDVIHGPTQEPRDLARREELGELARHLRKWVVFGFTYGEKRTGLFKLYGWNKRSGRCLDALTYLGRLLGQRVDQLWEIRPSSEGQQTAFWHIVRSPVGGRLLISSQTDGRIRAISENGHSLRWECSEAAADQLSKSGIEIADHGHALQHVRAEDFRKKHWHGPYARSMSLLPLPGDRQVLVFPLKGFLLGDRAEAFDEPRLCAVVLDAVGPDSGAVRILAASFTNIQTEVYAIEHLEKRGEEHVLVVGTSGRVGQEDRAFLQVRVTVRFAGNDPVDVEIRDEGVPVRLSTRGRRSSWSSSDGRKPADLRAIPHNPCWSLARLPSGSSLSAGRCCLWAGFHDGTIRSFQRIERDKQQVEWIECTPESSCGKCTFALCSPTPLKASAPIWQLRCFRSRERILLGYGTANGVIGVLPLTPADVADQEGGSSWVHLVHTRQNSAVCGLGEYQDDGQTRLAAITQDGSVSIFDVDSEADPLRASTSRAGPPDSGQGRIPGFREDHFGLGSTARCAIVRQDPAERHSGDESEPLPHFLVGSSDGAIRKYSLLFPRGCKRTADAEKEATDLVRYVVGALRQPGGEGDKGVRRFSNDVLEWIRVLEVSGPQLLRASLATELGDAALPLLDCLELQDATGFEKRVDEYIQCLDLRARDVYKRIPLDKQSIKVIYQQGAEIAYQIAEKAIDVALIRSDVAQRLVAKYVELNRRVDELCNHWIGLDQTAEAKVLISVLKALVDWPDIVLLALADPREQTVNFRKFFLFQALRKRLGYTDPLVPTETLRILNAAAYRAIVHMYRQKLNEPSRTLALRARESDVPSYYDLLVMVGDLAERHASTLSPTHPLATEISRFFALTMLLIPRSALHVGQIVSESGLVGHDSGLAKAIAQHAQSASSILGRFLGHAPSDWNDSIDLFRAYLSTEPDLNAMKATVNAETPWRKLLAAARECGLEQSMEADLLREMANVIAVTCSLASLERQPDESSEPMLWLKNQDAVYFSHSQAYLRDLAEHRRKVREILLDDDTSDEEVGETKPSRPGRPRALQECSNLEQNLKKADLFEPQQSHYGKVIQTWLGEIERRGQHASALMGILDGFNRHVYRTSADELMSHVTELAMQVAPIDLNLPDDEDVFRLRIGRALNDHSLVKKVFETGIDLVENTHLAGTLLELVRNDMEHPGVEDTSRTTLGELNLIIAEAARYYGLGIPEPLSRKELGLRGSRRVWETIVREFAKNTLRYCSGGPDPAKRLCLGFLDGSREPVPTYVLRLFGNHPFRTSFADLQEAIGRLSPDDAWDLLKARVADAQKPGRRFHARQEGSSGYGMTLIRKLFAMIRMDGSFVLAPPDDSSNLPEVTMVKRLDWPLCLEVRWTGGTPQEAG